MACCKPLEPDKVTAPVVSKGPTFGASQLTSVEFAKAKQDGESAHAKIKIASTANEIDRLLLDAMTKLEHALAQTNSRTEQQSLRDRLRNLETAARKRLNQLSKGDQYPSIEDEPLSAFTQETPSTARVHDTSRDGRDRAGKGSRSYAVKPRGGTATQQVSAGGKERAPSESTSGVVVFVAKQNFTIAELEQFSRYVNSANSARVSGRLSSTGRVSTTGELRADSSLDAARERKRAAAAGTAYEGQVGHAPDATWTGQPGSHEWHDQTPKVNASLGAQARSYPVGFVPTDFGLAYKWKS